MTAHIVSLPQPPPAYYTLYPRAAEPNAPQGAPAAKAAVTKPQETLITRYHLEQRISEAKDSSATTSATDPPHIWQDSAEKREASLRERKAKMIIAAREYVVFVQYLGGCDTDLDISPRQTPTRPATPAIFCVGGWPLVMTVDRPCGGCAPVFCVQQDSVKFVVHFQFHLAL